MYRWDIRYCLFDIHVDKDWNIVWPDMVVVLKQKCLWILSGISIFILHKYQKLLHSRIAEMFFRLNIQYTRTAFNGLHTMISSFHLQTIKKQSSFTAIYLNGFAHLHAITASGSSMTYCNSFWYSCRIKIEIPDKIQRQNMIYETTLSDIKTKKCETGKCHGL
jgi:hypothetical protein